PFFQRRTSGPTSSTTPQNSCPSTCGSATWIPSQLQSPVQRCQSDRQMPFASTRSTTPLSGGLGSGTSRTTSGWPIPSMTAAFMACLLRWVTLQYTRDSRSVNPGAGASGIPDVVSAIQDSARTERRARAANSIAVSWHLPCSSRGHDPSTVAPNARITPPFPTDSAPPPQIDGYLPGLRRHVRRSGRSLRRDGGDLPGTPEHLSGRRSLGRRRDAVRLADRRAPRPARGLPGHSAPGTDLTPSPLRGPHDARARVVG